MEQPTVTVIVPTYNREAWLRRSIDSVRNQTFQNWQLLIVDDGSTDGSFELVKELAGQDSRISWMRNVRTKGPAGARNSGIDCATGRYIAFLDSDDEWENF